MGDCALASLGPQTQDGPAGDIFGPAAHYDCVLGYSPGKTGVWALLGVGLSAGPWGGEIIGVIYRF